MSKVMLVNVTHVEESRVAVLDDGVLDAYEIETINRAHIKGNIHNAIVETVHPSLEAAFLKIGPDLNGFLPLDQVNFRLLPSRDDSRKSGKIGQHVRPGQKLMVQVVREPFAGKPPTVSTYFSLPGRFLVLMPGVDSSGISRKIEDGKQRDRLKKIVDDLCPPEGFGLIVRTAGIGQTKTELQRDLRYLLRLWESIQRSSAATEFPGLVYREADLVIRTIRDHLTPDISEVWIDSPETYEKALEFVHDVMPNRAKSLKLYTGDRPIFNKFNLEEQIERIYKRRVPLPAGGEIVIDGTEALTAVDVNSARSKKRSDVEETSLQTNMEAAVEIARQLRLRDLGGLVVIDFIDMLATRNRAKVEKQMRDSLRGDRAKYDVTRISKLGLMEIARQRLKGAKMAASYVTCGVCDGHGLIKNIETAALAALRKLQTRSSRGGGGKTNLSLPPEVATWLLNNKREELVRMERRQGMGIVVVPDPNLLRHDSRFEFIAGEAEAAAPPAPPEKSERETGDPPAERERAPRSRRSPRRSRKEPAAARPESDVVAEKTKTEDPGEEKEIRIAGKDEIDSQGESDKSERPGDEESAAPRPRRRRRRRRGGRGSGSTAAAGEERPQQSEPADPVEVVVPPSVQADELMPAASGGASRGRRRKPGGGRRTRRSPARD